ncbi:tripartite tricarboxylate transporter substrate binding protein [Halovulum dunhuangense]|uniref:Tripartite tricarboxylate transporter substrate binding protein n=1 Tax=Halovulum dunhuangense TaxID=1505036 RepID=A0A849L2N5_9RHOB|nr:tripartite tricarboxylate transporter substrate binding protein [Halovulum dunhuangense]NNU80500.1 tripartite tricarboxylate transporter substrate binding protein [Halovulum dunhuangense]
MKIRNALTAATVLTLATFGAAQAQDWPSGNVDYIIPFGPGGESDITARLQQPYFAEKFGQQLVVSYQPGGGGAVGWSQLNGMAADGSVIMGVNLPHIALQPQQGDVGYQTDDIAVVHMFHYTPDAILVSADSEFQTLEDLIAHAKENPRRVIFSGSGKGTANHLAQVALDKLAGIETTYVPFQGTGASVTALLGNQVTAQWGYTTVAAQQGEAVRMLAVAMEERHAAFPDVPTFRELGYDLVGGAYRGVAVPKDASEEVKQAVADAIAAINADPDFQKQMSDGGFALSNIAYGPDMDAFMADRVAAYTEAAKSAGVIE